MHIAAPSYAVGALFDATTLVRGQPQNIQCVDIGSKVFRLERGLLMTLHLEDEWFDDIDDPELVLKAIAGHSELRPDLFSFWQRLPDIEPKYDYHLEWQEIAVLPITSYDDWWEKKVKSRVRSQIRRAHKEGLVVKEVPYDDDFVRGMTTIFNESPVRQGRPFWHFGKDFETVKAQFSRFAFREIMIGAYYDDELIGFIMLANAGRFGLTCQIISSLRHRDKSPNNALIAKVVEVSARLKLDYLVYLFWGDDSLTEFKRRCGFEMMRAPRYSVPLTWKGALALKYGMHHGVKEAIPAPIKHRLKAWRNAWYRRHSD